MSEQKKQVLVIGNGMAGFRFCEKLLEYDAHHQYRITVLGEEPIPAYDRVSLSTLFSGKSDTDLILAEDRWYSYYKVTLKLGTRAQSINRAEKTVTATDGTVYAYDYLVIATGARPHIPAIEGTELDGVRVYRTPADVKGILQASRTATGAVIIGGGLLGLEAAEACRELGLETTVIEREAFLLACQLDEMAGEILDKKIEELGIHLRLNTQVKSIEGRVKVDRVRLEDGTAIPADLVIIATGILPNDELGRDARLELGSRGGIAVQNTVQTSDPAIFAIGECASFNNVLFGLIAPGYAMAEVAAAQLGEINKTFETSVPASKLKLLDLQVASIGETHYSLDEVDFVYEMDRSIGVYKKLLISKDWKKLIGAVLVGEISEFELIRKTLENGGDLPPTPHDLLAPVGEPFNAEIDMADDDVVCFCNYVTKGDICKAIDRDHLKTPEEVMSATYAASSCGSCRETVIAVTNQYVEHGI
ncbi:FAD-dependent oxidoreductase [Pontiellaceae bacterium B12219]|nr:FAD-dependent oxidoreductase [Pontiellaceae bacterium B12219]